MDGKKTRNSSMFVAKTIKNQTQNFNKTERNLDDKILSIGDQFKEGGQKKNVSTGIVKKSRSMRSKTQNVTYQQVDIA